MARSASPGFWVGGALVCGLVAALLTGCASKAPPAGAPPTSSAAPASTGVSSTAAIQPVAHTRPPDQDVFAPYDANGTLTAKIDRTVAGSCWTSSIAVPVAGVYRCLVGNDILDPCFAPAVETTPATVSCFDDPWDPGTTIQLSAALPTDHLILKDGSPWALELANGARCVLVTGAVPVLDDLSLQYRCDSDTVASLQTADDGSVSAMYGPSAGPLSQVAILAQWRGQSYRFGPVD